MTQMALLVETTAAALVGPVAGVAIARRRRLIGARAHAWGPVRRWSALAMVAAAGALGFTAVCLAANAVVGPGLTTLTAAPHVTLGAAFLAACALGIGCGQWFDDPLDAAACSLALSACASFGIFVLGPATAGAPAAAIDAALTLSPVSATASAADIDIFRSEPLYRLSPLAHTHLVYPAWTTATLVYIVIALAFLAGASRTPEVEGLSDRHKGLCPKG
jgi:hypothetical protein